MRKKLKILLIFIFFISGTVCPQEFNQTIQIIIKNTNLDTLKQFVKELSGEVSVEIDGNTFTINSRHANYPGNNIAADYIYQKLEQYGLDVYNQQFSSTGRNVYGIKWGIQFPEQEYIICAHYDTIPNGPISPGADDNASGTTAVLEAARLLSNYTTEYTIIFALWDEEERDTITGSMGLLGSEYFAVNANDSSKNLLGVVNVDMIGYDSNNDMHVDIHTREIANSVELANTTAAVNTLYNIGLEDTIYNPGINFSDHKSFWDNGFGAILLIEDFYNDFNDSLHTVNDLLSLFNHAYFYKCSQLATAVISTLGKVETSATSLENNFEFTNFKLFQNYPNPFNPTTQIRYEIFRSAFVTLKVYNILGSEVATLVNEKQPPGEYEVEFSAKSHKGGGLGSGVYYYRISVNSSAGIYGETKAMLLIK
jgi:hypothetical protein